MSGLTSTTARSWSGVSSYGKLASISSCHGVSGAYGVALDARPGRVQLEQLLGEVRDGLPDALLRPQPLGAAELREVRVLGAAVARDPVDLLDRDEDLVGAGEAQLEVVAVLAVGPVAAPEHPLVAGDAVVDVDDEVARRQPLEDVARDDPPERLGPADADRAEQLAVGDEDEAVRPALEAAVEAALDERDRARRRCLRGVDDGDRGGRPRRGARRGAAPGRRRGRSGRRRAASVDRAPRSPRRGPAGAPARASRTGRRSSGRGRRAPPTPAAPTPTSARASGCATSRRLPRPRPEVGRRPVLRQVAGLDELRPALVGLAPEELRRLGDVARLVDDEERVVRSTWSSPVAGARRGAQTSAASPTFSARVSASPPANRSRSAASRSGSFAARRPSASRSAAAPPCGWRNSDAGRRTASSSEPTVRWSVGSNARSESISSPKNSIRTGSGADGGKTSTRPPRRANSPRPATSSTGA